MILNIRTAVRTQITEIAEVFASCFSEDKEISDSYDRSYIENCLKNSLLTATITCDKTVRGVCVCESLPIPDSCEITAIYITDGFRGIGLGRKLLLHSLREMRAKRCRSAFVWLDKKNVRAERFFKRIGFLHDGRERRIYRKNGEITELRYQIDI